MRASVPCLIGAVALIAPATALAHVDDPKATSVVPRFEGPGWTEAEGGVAGAGFASSSVILRSWISLVDFGHAFGNDCWGYTSPSGREYAIMGLYDGTSFVEITDPGAPVELTQISGPTSTWRDIKTYGDNAYMVSEAGDGIQIVDMSAIDSGVVTFLGTVTTPGTTATHNVAINEASGRLYRCGGGGLGLRIYDLNADPDNPTFIGEWHDRYVHDAEIHTMTTGAHAGKEIAFLCGGLNNGNVDTRVEILDVTDPQNIQAIGFLSYANAVYCHQAWLSDDEQYLYMNDEINEVNLGVLSTTHVINISNLNAPFEVTQFTNGNTASTHNLYVKDDKLYAANYRSGLRVYDITNRNSPVEVGYFDTFPGSDVPDYSGLWSTFPYFDSGTVIGSDRQRGLFVWSEGVESVGMSYPGGTPEFLDPTGQVLNITVSTASGSDIVDESSGLLHYDDGTGYQTVPLIPAEGLGGGEGSADYTAQLPGLDCPGAVDWYVTILDDSGSTWRDPFNGSYTATVAVGITAVFEDDFESDLGWGVTGDADEGIWARGTPQGAGDRGDPAVDADGSGQCYLTDPGDGNTDVDNGTTTLTSPVLDATGDGDAYLVYDRWYSNNFGGAPDEDSMPIEISNNGGSSWMLVEDVTENAGVWVNKAWRIDDILTPTTNMRVRFHVGDLLNGSVVEAGIDAVQVSFFECAEATPCPGDANGDLVVDVNDLNAVILDWGTDGTANGGDLTGQTPGSLPDGAVDVNDLNAVIVSWGVCP